MLLEDRLLTEARNPESEAVDRLSASELVALMTSEDAKAVEAVRGRRTRSRPRSSGRPSGSDEADD